MRNAVAAYFFMLWDTENEDSNRILTVEEKNFYHSTAQRFIDAVSDLYLQLGDYEGSTDEEIQAFMYDVGKRHFGATKDELRLWFSCLYSIVNGQKSGPRLGTLINLIGIEGFLDFIERKIARPF